MSGWIDSHAHLSMLAGAEGDLDPVGEVLERASEAGVVGVLSPATGASDLDATVALGERFADRVVVALGVHPHEASTLDAALKRRLQGALERPGVVAVGEIGLDYHYMSSPREDQLQAFAWQLDLAAEVGLPVIVHNRESWSDLEATLAQRAGRLRGGVCHSFTEPVAAAQRVAELGLMVGISGMVTFPSADVIRETARSLSAEQVLVETDSPYLAPVPHRGRRNEPAYVRLVGERLAAELAVEPAVLAASTTASFRRRFRLGDDWPGRG